MKKFPIENLARIIKAHPPNRESNFTGVSIDSRTTQPGDCFFAITGENFNGHNFLIEAFNKGAACAVVGKNYQNEKLTDKIILKVDDTKKALGDFARVYRRQNKFKVIAITGSVGKTTTRQIIYHVLSRHFRVTEAPKNFNNNIGLPLTLLSADPDHQIVITELGSSSPGEIAYLTKIASPDIAVITNICPAHLKGFGDIETILKEKLSIAEGLKQDGLFILNADINSNAQHKVPSITFSSSEIADIQAKNITTTGAASRFTINETEIFLPLPGQGNIENALAAYSVCSQFEITLDDFANALKSLNPISMRTELMQIGSLTLLNDCYNANPTSMKNALDILTNLTSAENKRPVLICSDMAELGQQTEKLHSELGISITQTNIQLLLTIGKLAKIVAEEAKKNAKHDLQIKSFEDTLSACNNLAKFIKDDDIILVKGSRNAKLELVIEKLKKLFS